MSTPIAGWYPDPANDSTKLRYWDGNAWTEKTMDRPVETVGAAPTQGEPANQAQNAQPTQTQQASAAQPQNNVGAQNNPYNVQVNIVDPTKTTYQLTSEDSTLRLIAFIFAIISTVSTAVFILPLCWMIPMTVHCWGLYKGNKPNTVAFGVCTLIFLSIVSGILLLVSTKEEQ